MATKRLHSLTAPAIGLTDTYTVPQTVAELEDGNTVATKTEVSTEKSARESADSALQTAINAKASSADLTAETTARTNADNQIYNELITEKSSKTSKTKIAYEIATTETEIPTMTEFNKVASDLVNLQNMEDGTITKKLREDIGKLEDCIGYEDESEDADLTNYSIGNIYGDIGSILVEETSSSYAYKSFDLDVNTVSIDIETKTGTNERSGYYVFLTDESNKIIERYVAPRTISESVTLSITEIPNSAKKLWVKKYGSSNYNVTIVFNLRIYTDLKDSLDSKLNTNQGIENSGKTLVVGEDGKITLKDDRYITVTEQIDTSNCVSGTFYGDVGSQIQFESASFKYVKLDANKGDSFTIKTLVSKNANVSAYACFTNESGIILSKFIAPTGVQEEITETSIAPDGTRYLYVKSYGTSKFNASGTRTYEKEKVKSTVDGLNDYYFEDDWYEDMLENINLQATIDKGLSFVFATDLHFKDNQKQSKYLIRQILDKTCVSFCVCGGDFVNAFIDTANHNLAESTCIQSAEELERYRECIGASRFFSVRGNHDFTVKYKNNQHDVFDGTGITETTSFAYNHICDEQSRWVSKYSEHGCWYLDDAVQKVRIIGVNSEDNNVTSKIINGHYIAGRITQEQVEWIISEALNCSDYTLIFVSHIPSDSTISGYEPNQQVIHELELAINNKSNLNYTWNVTTTQIGTVTHDFTDTTNVVACHICGHNHVDESHIDNGLLTISTTSDAGYGDGGWTRTDGTVNEQAFDVFTINTDSKTIKAYRVGAGNSRNWTY